MEGASILIVEDEAISALYLKNLLTRLKYQVLDIVASGENAVTRAGDLKPDLVLMDIRLAGEMDGIQAADIIHSNHDIPVVFLTAHLDEDSMRRAMSTDPAGYVPKPTSERELRGTIEMALKNDLLKKQLRASEARFRRIFNTASVSISEIDFSQVKKALDDLRQSGISDLQTYLETNSKYLRELLSLVEILDVNDWNLQLFNAPDRKKFSSALRKFIRAEGLIIFQKLVLAIWKGESYYEGEGVIRTLTGEKKYVTMNVAFLTGGIDLSRVLMIVTDITEGKLAEAALRESEEKYRRMVNTAQEGIWILDANYKTSFVNNRILEMFGYKTEEMIGHEVEDFLFPEQHAFYKDRLNVRENGITERYEMRFRSKAGLEQWVIISAAPMLDERQKYIGSFAMLTDITERKRAEQALSESEERYRQIVETTQEGVWILDKHFKMAFVNNRIINMFGYSYEELMEKSTEDLIFPEDLADHKAQLAEHAKGNVGQYERRFRRKDGSPIWMNVSATPIINQNGEFQGSVSMFTDISVRKQAEKVLEHQQMIAQMMDSLSQELLKLNLDFRVTLQNAAKIVSEKSGDLCIIRLVSDDGQFVKPVTIQHPNLKKQAEIKKCLQAAHIKVDEGLFSAIVKTGQSMIISRGSTTELLDSIPDQYKTMIEKHNIISGLSIPLRVQGLIIGDLTLGRSERQEPYSENDRIIFQEVADRIGLTIANARMYSKAQQEIEERRKIETEVRLSEEKYRDLFELSPDSIVLISPEGIILDCNLSTSHITGLPKEAMVGKLLYKIVTMPPEMFTEYTALFNGVMAEEQILPFEIEITRHDGQKLDLELFPKLIKKEGVLTGVQIISRNVTERKLNEQKIKDSLAEKEILLSELNHRVKNNLSSIVSILDLQKSYISDDQMVDLVTELQERVRLMALIHEQLYRSKNLNQIDFAKYLEDLTANLMRALLKGREILLDIHADPAQLGVATAIPCGQIVTELVTNALKYAFPDEKRDLWKDSGRLIEVGFKAEGDRFILKVSDNGIGLPAGLNFANAETLGMQLVALLANQLNGTIDFNGHPGVTVSITFPSSSKYNR